MDFLGADKPRREATTHPIGDPERYKSMRRSKSTYVREMRLWFLKEKKKLQDFLADDPIDFLVAIV
jgi:hypothetical protein